VTTPTLVDGEEKNMKKKKKKKKNRAQLARAQACTSVVGFD
jgi:hypothetical protein